MSTIPLPDKPAFSGLKSPERTYLELPPEQTSFVCGRTGKKGVVYRLETSARYPCGHYVLRSEGANWFIKIKDPTNNHNLQSQLIAFEAAGNGAPVVASELCEDPENFFKIEIQPFVESRLPKCDPNDASLTGKALAQMHLALRKSEQKALVRQNTLARHLHLAEIYRDIENKGRLPFPLDITLLDLRGSKPFQFDLAIDGQIIHGDLNIGNILIEKSSNSACFIDCENMSLSWLSPLVDIGMVIQRQILVAEASNSVKEAAIYNFLLSYQDTSLGKIAVDGERLVRAIAWTCMRNICLLLALRHQGREPEKTEWLKFQSLVQLNQEWADRVSSAAQIIKSS
ncbi:phosphotransferase [Thalassospira alkalitolerans]|uniref:phosphotransferase n=1 Tax=Thalassospira alkalitolerans TaxID=1293890 RepID=UPI003AA8BA79